VVGGLLGYVAVSCDRREQGLDGALRTILDQRFGKFLLTAVAVGFAAFGTVLDAAVKIPPAVNRDPNTRR
jgi:hypothetical protein